MQRLAIGGAVLALALLGPAEVVFGQTQRATTEQSKGAKAANQPQPAAPTPVPVPLPKEEPKPAIYNPDCTKPQNREDADYCAQRDMARAAERTLKSARWAVGIAILDTVLIMFGLGLTVVGVRTARRALDGLERPYLFLTLCDVDFFPRVATTVGETEGVCGARLRFALRNYGRSPCTLRQIDIGFAQAAHVEDVTSWEGVLSNPNTIIAVDDPNAEVQIDYIEYKFERYPASAAIRLRERKDSAFASGKFLYEDVFGNTYLRAFCVGKKQGRDSKQQGGKARNFDKRVREPFGPLAFAKNRWSRLARKVTAPRAK